MPDWLRAQDLIAAHNAEKSLHRARSAVATASKKRKKPAAAASTAKNAPPAKKAKKAKKAKTPIARAADATKAVEKVQHVRAFKIDASISKQLPRWIGGKKLGPTNLQTWEQAMQMLAGLTATHGISAAQLGIEVSSSLQALADQHPGARIQRRQRDDQTCPPTYISSLWSGNSCHGSTRHALSRCCMSRFSGCLWWQPAQR